MLILGAPGTVQTNDMSRVVGFAGVRRVDFYLTPPDPGRTLDGLHLDPPNLVMFRVGRNLELISVVRRAIPLAEPDDSTITLRPVDDMDCVTIRVLIRHQIQSLDGVSSL